MLLILLFSLRLGWLPPSGSYGWEYWIMPIGITGLNGAAYIMRMTRSSMLEVVRQDYMRTARAKGQTEYITITRHAMKNALLPIVTATGFQVAHMFSGAVLIETVFAMPGIGKFLIDSVSNKDYPSVAGAVFFIAVACVVVNLIVDVIYVFIDPRIKTAYQANKKKNRPVINAGNGNSEKAGVLNG
jgi:peptide/nickel transport system permease protein